MKGYCRNCNDIIPVLRGPQMYCKPCALQLKAKRAYGPTRENPTRIMWEMSAQENDGVRSPTTHAPLVELPGSGEGREPPARPLNGHHSYCFYGIVPHSADICRGFWN